MLSRLSFLAVFIAALTWTAVCDLDAEPIGHRLGARSAFRYRSRGLKNVTSGTTPTETSGRKSGGTCAWNEETSTCDASLTAISSVLKQLPQHYGPFLAQFTECASATNAESCNAYEQCHWDSGVCHLVRNTVSLETSPCYNKTPATVDDFFAEETCTLHTTQLPCLADSHCQWDEEDHICFSNFFWFYYSISDSDLASATEAVFDAKLAQLREMVLTSFDTQDPDFDWSVVLDWEIPETECPTWADKIICSMIDVILQAAGSDLYCGGRYGSPDQLNDCAEDELCHFDMSSFSCREGSDSYRFAISRSYLTLSPLIAEDADRDILTTAFTCSAKETEEECTGDCEWFVYSEGDEECDTPANWTALAVADAGGDPDDGVCLYAAALGHSGCTALEGVDECSENPNCASSISDSCWPTAEYVVNFASQRDGELAAQLQGLEEQCDAYTTEQACLAAGHSHTAGL